MKHRSHREEPSEAARTGNQGGTLERKPPKKKFSHVKPAPEGNATKLRKITGLRKKQSLVRAGANT